MLRRILDTEQTLDGILHQEPIPLCRIHAMFRRWRAQEELEHAPVSVGHPSRRTRTGLCFKCLAAPTIVRSEPLIHGRQAYIQRLGDPTGAPTPFA